MQGNDDPVTSTKAHQVASRHYQGQGQRSSSSSPPSPRVATYADHQGFDDPAGRRAQDSDPYPLWTRPSTSTKASESPRRPSSPSSVALPRALAPSSSSSSSLLTAPAPTTTPGCTPPAAMNAVPARPTAPCQHPGCSRPAKYGPKDTAPIACQAHKRIGQFTTNRHGELLRATKHGDAFRTPPAPSTMSPSSGSTSTTDGSGKKSFGQGAARPSAPPAQGVKRKSRPGSSSVNDDQSPALQKKRACLFPGCGAHPVYGLMEAVHPVYCFSHKKGTMVPIVKEAPGLHDIGDALEGATAVVTRKGAAGKSRIKTPAVASGRGKQKSLVPSTTAVYGNGAKEARPVPKEGDDSGDDDDEDHTKKSRGNGGKNNRGGSVASKVADLPATSDSRRGTPADDAVITRPSAASSRMGHASGMAPSAEIGLIRQAREAAQKEAEAAGGGRRARAPSRRALEASGRMTDQGAQWMTQEKKKEQAQAAMELKEQRKRYRAAGLKLGVVMEEYVVKKAGTAAATATGAAGSGASRGEGDSGREGGDSGVGPPLTVAGWRKVSPVALSALLNQAGAQEAAAPVAAGERP